MSTPRRFFVEYELNGRTEVFLEGEEFTHAKTVLRLEEGAEIVLLDGSGKEFSAIVAKIEKHRLLAHITGAKVSDKEPETEICLLCGVLKGDKTELVVQKATELGVTEIFVFSSEYCSAYMNENKLERLNKVAREAAKQCLRACAPKVKYFDNLNGALSCAKNYVNKLFACEFLSGGNGMPNVLNGSAAVVVGSEGGLSDREFELAKSLGFIGVSLGKRILRAETAAISMCTLAAYALGELE